MKKIVSSTLAAVLLATCLPAAFAADVEKGNGNGKAEAKAESTESSDVDANRNDAAVEEPAIKDETLKKQLIELRQELKQTAEVTAEQKAKYEQLVADLEKIADKHSALDVQLELLQRTYQKGDYTPFQKLGQLLEETGETEVKAFVDGQLVESDAAPFVQGGRALVPVRAISSALKADVQWDATARTVVITRGEQSITLYLDKKEASVNGETVALDIAPVLKNGRVFLPLRFIGEQLKASVEWQEEGKIVIIDDLQQTDETADDQDASASADDTDTDEETN